MLLAGKQLSAHLERKLLPVYAVHGDDPLLVIEACDAIRAAARCQRFDEREVLTSLPGFNWALLFNAASNLSLFGGRKLIDLRIPTGKPGREGSEALKDYCAKAPSDTLLLLTLPKLDWAEEKAVWLKTLAETGAVVKLTAPSLHELPGWIAERLKQQGQQADPESLLFIAERVQGNLLAAHQEIQKLKLLYPAARLSLQEVRSAVLNVTRYDIDDLREALLCGDIKRFSRVLEGLKQEGEPLPLLLWAMTEEIRALCHVKTGLDSGKPMEPLLKEARVWGNRQTAFRRAVARISAARARAALTDASHIDQLIKGIGRDDLWNRLLRLGASLCEKASSIAPA